MSTTVRIRDEQSGGPDVHEFTLSFLEEQVTIRELIRARVWQEVSEYNARPAAAANWLVRPAAEELTLNGRRETRRRQVDWELQFTRALRAFESNGFLLFIDNRQVTELDEPVTLRHDSDVTFLKLTPLVGG